MPNYSFTVHTTTGRSHPGNISFGLTEREACEKLSALWHVLCEADADSLIERIECTGVLAEKAIADETDEPTRKARAAARLGDTLGVEMRDMP